MVNGTTIAHKIPYLLHGVFLLYKNTSFFFRRGNNFFEFPLGMFDYALWMKKSETKRFSVLLNYVIYSMQASRLV